MVLAASVIQPRGTGRRQIRDFKNDESFESRFPRFLSRQQGRHWRELSCPALERVFFTVSANQKAPAGKKSNFESLVRISVTDAVPLSTLHP
jgi:hypothetical protein